MKEDLELINDILNDRSKALERLYDRFAPSLLSLCYRYTANVQDAEDVLHDGFIKILKKLPDFKPKQEYSLEAWMKRIMTNTALNFIRDHAKERFALDVGDIRESGYKAEEETGEFDISRLSLSQDQIMQIITDLPPGYRTVFNLYVFEEFSHKEISAQLGCSENTSKSQLSKARAALRLKIFELINVVNVK